ncbi:TRNA-(Guanine-N1)-methyltransferase [Nostocoides japonicum T1-X7]|uniref:tRNA (guanine-N(1)-)-methyltransferase n=1 Tax=Nostocoides japonicum T1-X7 TaxID=1194083 RepID=A0A077LTK6_9MICO|nr:tRNA (guanosine(37)-N1)-methyltransferase TrmD [Tetrasphaera japonica]CCH76913.1 TRNA-(Guanine-N1)-methyltransferase [Tetrasphaera japonica T1-X7]
MRIDVVTIFPAYLEPLGLSLIGTARRAGLLDIRVHDLRDHTHDRHRTVDDSPFGGGAGMVMKPEPWAAALDAVVASAPAAGAVPHLIVPGPGGVPFTQALARSLATEPWLAFACGRYEGIDERVYEHASARMPVTVVSLGDYVLGGGEVAVLAIVEAVARLLPGVIGNADSLVEESHEDGLLEYPVYTRPASWVDGAVVRDVPPVLLSGDHAAIAAWRHEQRVRRTAARRPDLLARTATVSGLGDLDVAVATPADAPELLTLQRACWVSEAIANDSLGIPPLHEDLATVTADLGTWRTWVFRVRGDGAGAGREGTGWAETGRAEAGQADVDQAETGRAEAGRGGAEQGGRAKVDRGGRLVASVRARCAPDDETTWQIGRLMVAPDLQGRGLGRALLGYAEAAAPPGTRTLWLTTGAGSTRNLRAYRKAGYRVRPGEGAVPGTVELTKPVR